MRRTISLLFVIILLVSMVQTGMAELLIEDLQTVTPKLAVEKLLTSSPTPTATPEPVIDKTLSKGDAGEEVSSLQVRLVELGLLEGTADGLFGGDTESAVKKFQQYMIDKKGRADIITDGVVTEEIERLLYDESYAEGIMILAYGSRGDAVQELQEHLYELGFLTGSIDGIFAKETERAVKTFQELMVSRGHDEIEVNGIADKATRQELYNEGLTLYESDLSLGDTGNAVLRLQSKLYVLGYSSFEPDGKFSEVTRNSLRSFQKGMKLKQTGIADKATQDLLFSDQALESELVLTKQLSPGSKGAAVRRLQENLVYYGFLDGAIDGSYGSATAAAVKELERQLIALGYADVITDGIATAEEQDIFYADDFSPYVKSFSEGDTDPQIVHIVRRLCDLNYMDADEDGVFDPYTFMAVELFQRNNGLEATGVADRATINTLYSNNAVKAERAIRRNLYYGDTGITVREFQERLSVLGFYYGTPSGKFDSGTSNGIGSLLEHIQALGSEANELASMKVTTKEVSADFQRYLLAGVFPSYLKSVRRGDKGDEVYRVQKRLSSLYYMGTHSIDGAFGAVSVNAITQFQKANGLRPTGVANRVTQKVLFSDAAIYRNSKYMLKVSVDEQRVYAFEFDTEVNEYKQIREMICSTGLVYSSTPKGIYVETTGPQHVWHYFKEFYCWAKYTYIIRGDIMFHSVLYSRANTNSLKYSSLYNLGRRASHGCVRLRLADAEWIYENCEKQTTIVIY